MTGPADGAEPARRLSIELDLAAEDDVSTLRGALLAARATELGELQRRAGRLSFGYGTDSARDAMDDETRRLRRRIELLDHLLAALDQAATRRQAPPRGAAR
jgi:hypothetical protein